MPRVAQFIVIPESDTAFTLPDPANGLNDRHFLNIRLPNVDAGARAVLAFRVNPGSDESVRLVININNTNVVNVTFTSDPQRSWHEIVPRNILMAEGNSLDVAVVGSGSIQVSDIILFYQANIPG